MLNWIHSYRNGFLDTFFRTITHAGSLYFVLSVAIILLVFLIHSEKYGETKMLVTTIVMTIVLSHGMKLFFKRPRPDIHPPIISMPADWSFPSAHTAQITALSLCACIIALRSFPNTLAWCICILAFTMIGLVGFSRMYLQVHHPTDVIAGFLLAGGIVVISQFIFKS